MRKSGFDLSDSIGANRILRGEPNSEPAILAWLLSAWAKRAVKPRGRFVVHRRRSV